VDAANPQEASRTARLADERLWIGVLEQGAYDLIQNPFRADELRCILENAHSHATTGAPFT
jgi:FixJ family two-component response regulator